MRLSIVHRAQASKPSRADGNRQKALQVDHQRLEVYMRAGTGTSCIVHGGELV